MMHNFLDKGPMKSYPWLLVELPLGDSPIYTPSQDSNKSSSSTDKSPTVPTSAGDRAKTLHPPCLKEDNEVELYRAENLPEVSQCDPCEADMPLPERLKVHNDILHNSYEMKYATVGGGHRCRLAIMPEVQEKYSIQWWYCKIISKDGYMGPSEL